MSHNDSVAMQKPLRSSRSFDKLNIFKVIGKKRRSEALQKDETHLARSSQTASCTAQTTEKSFTANCCVCNSGLKFCATSTCFRCTICNTINDIKDSPCDDSLRPLSLKELDSLTERSEYGSHEQQYESVVKRISVVFSSTRCLNESFPSGCELSHTDPGMDLSAVRRMYSYFARDPVLMQLALQTTEALLARPGKRIRKPHEARFLLILLENPQLKYRKHKLEGLAGQHLLKKILGLISSLPNEVHQYIVNWIGRYPQPIFQNHVDLINGFLSHRLGKLNKYRESRTYHSCWQVKAASRTMALLYCASSLRHSLPVSSFYNAYIDYLDIDADYIAWVGKIGIRRSHTDRSEKSKGGLQLLSLPVLHISEAETENSLDRRPETDASEATASIFLTAGWCQGRPGLRSEDPA